MSESRKSIIDFAVEHKIEVKCKREAKRPDKFLTKWPNHFKCVVKKGPARMTVHFSMGSAHTKPPKPEDILNGLSIDASSYENSPSLVDFAAEFGSDPDDRETKRTFNATKKSAIRLKKLLGDGAYEDLLWNTEGL